ncbi:hypothetical protein [Nocardioides sp.]|uniref:hypothetical protein n=1 Tax=Nocardioides sp. TaxID=35761 RepID=UPI0035B0938C
MNWITTTSATVALSAAEVAALADRAARYDVLGGHDYNPTPGLELDALLGSAA